MLKKAANNITGINIISALFLQLVTIISGFIIPRVMLSTFGSEVNGLVSSITQFLNYISLLEGGVGAVIATSLYLPLNKRNNNKISAIIKSSHLFFKKLAKIFLAYSFVLACLYPVIVRGQFNFTFIFTLTIILSVSLFTQYNFSITWRILLKADRKVFVSAFIDSFAIILHTGIIVLAVHIYPEVRFVRLMSAISYVVQPLIYDHYVKRHYSIDNKASPDKSALEQRWDGFGINLSAFLNANIDVIVLTLFSTLINVSIYSVYALVTTGLSSLIKSISAGFNPTLGKSYANGDRKDVIRVLSRFENTILYFSFCVYTCAAILIVPFVQNYTKGIVDANYYQPVFAMILLLSSLIYCLREPYVNLAYIANRFHEISKYAYLEAGINLVVSIIAVNKFGLNGVAFGTLCSMTYRTVFQLVYMRKRITLQSNFRTLLKVSLFLLGSLVGFLVANMLISSEVGSSWISWILNSALCVLIVFPMNAVVLILINTLEKRNE